METGESARTSATREVYEAALRRCRKNFHPAVREHAEDIAQDVVVRYLEVCRTQVIEEPGAWANVAAWRLSGHLVKQLQAGQAPEAAEGWERQRKPEDPRHDAFVEFLADGQPTSAIGILREQADRLMAMLDDQETEFVLLVASGYTQAEIAEVLGYANADVVKTTLNRKRKQLKAAAAEAGIESDWQVHVRPY